ncbi:MAG: hypothetical protein ACRY3E_00600 [Candidatus Lariskella arthropodorum]
MKKYKPEVQNKAHGLQKSYHGILYQIKVLLFTLLVSSKNQTKNKLAGDTLKLRTEVQEAKKFDDLVWECVLDGTPYANYMQIKHSVQKTLFIKNEMLGFTGASVANDDFNIAKYFISFRTIKDARPNTEVQVQREFILWANLPIDKNSLCYFVKRELADLPRLLYLFAQEDNANLLNQEQVYKLNPKKDKVIDVLRNVSVIYRIAKALYALTKKQYKSRSVPRDMLAHLKIYNLEEYSNQLKFYIVFGRITSTNISLAEDVVQSLSNPETSITDNTQRGQFIRQLSSAFATVQEVQERKPSISAFYGQSKRLKLEEALELPPAWQAANVKQKNIPLDLPQQSEIDDFIKNFTLAVQQPGEQIIGDETSIQEIEALRGFIDAHMICYSEEVLTNVRGEISNLLATTNNMLGWGEMMKKVKEKINYFALWGLGTASVAIYRPFQEDKYEDVAWSTESKSRVIVTKFLLALANKPQNQNSQGKRQQMLIIKCCKMQEITLCTLCTWNTLKEERKKGLVALRKLSEIVTSLEYCCESSVKTAILSNFRNTCNLLIIKCEDTQYPEGYTMLADAYKQCLQNPEKGIICIVTEGTRNLLEQHIQYDENQVLQCDADRNLATKITEILKQNVQRTLYDKTSSSRGYYDASLSMNNDAEVCAMLYELLLSRAAGYTPTIDFNEELRRNECRSQYFELLQNVPIEKLKVALESKSKNRLYILRGVQNNDRNYMALPKDSTPDDETTQNNYHNCMVLPENFFLDDTIRCFYDVCASPSYKDKTVYLLQGANTMSASTSNDHAFSLVRIYDPKFYITDSKRESEILSLINSQEARCTIINGEAGAGKSTLLSRLIFFGSSEPVDHATTSHGLMPLSHSHIVIKINAINNTDLQKFNNCKFRNATNDEARKQLIADWLSTRHTSEEFNNDFTRLFIKLALFNSLRYSPLMIVLDGVDHAFSSKDEKSITEMLCFLAREGSEAKIVITTRTLEVRRHLETTLTNATIAVHCAQLAPLSMHEQKRIQERKFLRESIPERDGSSIGALVPSLPTSALLSNALYLNCILESDFKIEHEEQKPHFLVYKKIVEKQFDIHCALHAIEVVWNKSLHRDAFFGFFQNLAMLDLNFFKGDRAVYLKDIELFQFSGLIIYTNNSDDQHNIANCRFTHLIFAEYFAYTKLISDIPMLADRPDQIQLITDFLLSDECVNARSFFEQHLRQQGLATPDVSDRLAKRCNRFNEDARQDEIKKYMQVLCIATKEKNAETLRFMQNLLKNCILLQKCKATMTPLHIAAQYFSAELSNEESKVVEILLGEETLKSEYDVQNEAWLYPMDLARITKKEGLYNCMRKNGCQRFYSKLEEDLRSEEWPMPVSDMLCMCFNELKTLRHTYNAFLQPEEQSTLPPIDEHQRYEEIEQRTWNANEQNGKVDQAYNYHYQMVLVHSINARYPARDPNQIQARMIEVCRLTHNLKEKICNYLQPLLLHEPSDLRDSILSISEVMEERFGVWDLVAISDDRAFLEYLASDANDVSQDNKKAILSQIIAKLYNSCHETNGMTPLDYAAEFYSLKIFAWLHHNIGNVEMSDRLQFFQKAQNTDRISDLLKYAVQQKNTEILWRLLELSYAEKAPITLKLTELGVLPENASILFRVASSPNSQYVKAIIADILGNSEQQAILAMIEEQDEYKNTIIHILANQAEQDERLAQIFHYIAQKIGHEKLQEIISSRNAEGFTPLHCAANMHAVPMLRALHKCGAKITDTTECQRQTILHLAAARGGGQGAQAFCAWLTQIDVSDIINELDANQYTALGYAIVYGNQEVFDSLQSHQNVVLGTCKELMHRAIEARFVKGFLYLAENYEMCVSLDDLSDTPLHIAAADDADDIPGMDGNSMLHYIIQRGVSIDCKNVDNKTPLHCAIETYRYKNVRRLLHEMQNKYGDVELKSRIVEKDGLLSFAVECCIDTYGSNPDNHFIQLEDEQRRIVLLLLTQFFSDINTNDVDVKLDDVQLCIAKLLEHAITRNDIATVQLLLQYYRYTQRAASEYALPLHIAAGTINLYGDQMIESLVRSQASCPDSFHWTYHDCTVLEYAIICSRVDIVRHILSSELGKELNQMDYNRQQRLMQLIADSKHHLIQSILTAAFAANDDQACNAATNASGAVMGSEPYRPTPGVPEAFSSYYQDQVALLLKLRLKDAAPELLNSVNILEENYILRENNEDYIAEKLSSFVLASEKETILMPLNIVGSHLVGIAAVKGKDNVVMHYMDSEQTLPPDLLMIKIRSVLKANDYFMELRIGEVEEQKYSNCGSEVIENFIHFLKVQRATQEDAVPIHSLLLENSILDQDTYIDQIEQNKHIITSLSSKVISHEMGNIVYSTNEVSVALATLPQIKPNAFVAICDGGEPYVFTTSYHPMNKPSSAIYERLYQLAAQVLNKFDVTWRIKKVIYRADVSHFNQIMKHYNIKHSIDVLKDNSKVKKALFLKLHSDKGGDDDDFRFIMNLKQKFEADLKVPEGMQVLPYKAISGFKMLDTAVDLARLMHAPNQKNMEKAAVNSAQLYAIYSGVNFYSTAITALDVAHHYYICDYKKVLESVVTAACYMALPKILGQLGTPYISFAYSAAITAHSGYKAVSNAYSLYLEVNTDQPVNTNTQSSDMHDANDFSIDAEHGAPQYAEL